MPKGKANNHVIFIADPALGKDAFDDVLNSLAAWQVELVTDWEATVDLAPTSHVGLFFISDSAALNATSLNTLNGLLSRGNSLEWIAITTDNQLANPAYTALLAHHVSDYFTYPLATLTHRLDETIGHANGMARLRAQHRLPDQGDFGIIGKSPAMKKIYDLIPRLGHSTAPTLITGDTGTGKELIAKTIHRNSARASGPFIAVNCGAIPEQLVESELFGHRKGAFTGADRNKIGFIQAADGGTLLLDEIGDLPAHQQVKLLRFLQEGTINPVGSPHPVEVDARVIAATHLDLEKAAIEGDFREDLFYRLNVLQLHVPRLIERLGDIEILANHFLNTYKSEGSTKINGFSDHAIKAMKNHTWRGNIRELINRIRKGVVLCDSSLIEPEHIGLSLAPESMNNSVAQLSDSVDVAEKEAIENALCACDNNISKTARELGVSRMTLYRLLRKHQLLEAG